MPLIKNILSHFTLTTQFKKLLLLAAPIAATQFSQMAMGVVDTVMSGNASAEDLAAVAVGSSIWVPIMFFMAGVLTAITPTVAQYCGAKQYSNIGHSIRQSFWLALLLAVFAFIALISVHDLFVFMNVEATILPIATGYLYALAWSMPAIAGFFVLRFLNEGMANIYPVMFIGFMGLGVNILANYILIFGHFGAPVLGGVGAGWATTITFWFMLISLFIYILNSQKFIHIELFKADVKPHIEELRALVKLGVPIGITFFVEGSVFSIIALFLASVDVISVAAHQIALNFSSLVFLLPLSLSISLTIQVGHQIGAQQYHLSRESIKAGLIMSLCTSILSAFIIFNFAVEIAQLYNDNPKVIQLASSLMIFTAIYQFSDGIQLCAAGSLRGLKDTRIPMLLSIISYWVIGFPLGYTLAMTDLISNAMGAKGFWMGLIIALTVSAVLMTSRLYIKMSKYAKLDKLNLNP